MSRENGYSIPFTDSGRDNHQRIFRTKGTQTTYNKQFAQVNPLAGSTMQAGVTTYIANGWQCDLDGARMYIVMGSHNGGPWMFHSDDNETFEPFKPMVKTGD